VRERIEDSALRAQVLTKVGEVACKIPILTQPVTDVARGTEGALVPIINAGCDQNPRERVLGEAFAAREWQLAHIQQLRDAGAP